MVILGSDFERLQIIPGAKHGNIQVGCVDCSLQGGQVSLMERCFILPKFNTQLRLCKKTFVSQNPVQSFDSISDSLVFFWIWLLVDCLSG